MRGARVVPMAMLLVWVVGFVSTSCGVIAGFLPRREPPLITTRADSGWQVTKNFALISAKDQCADLLLRALFENVGFDSGRVVLLSTDLRGHGPEVEPNKVADLYYALGPLMSRETTDEDWQRFRYVSQFDVQRSTHRVIATMAFSESEIRGLFKRMLGSVPGDLPVVVETKIDELKSQRPVLEGPQRVERPNH